MWVVFYLKTSVFYFSRTQRFVSSCFSEIRMKILQWHRNITTVVFFEKQSQIRNCTNQNLLIHKHFKGFSKVTLLKIFTGHFSSIQNGHEGSSKKETLKNRVPYLPLGNVTHYPFLSVANMKSFVIKITNSGRTTELTKLGHCNNCLLALLFFQHKP